MPVKQKPKAAKKSGKPGRKEEVLIISDDPEKALARLMKPKPAKKR